MADRTVIEWDKDDLDALGILKIDVLALGMLTCIRKAFELIARHHGTTLDARRPCRPRTRRSTTCCAGPTRIGVFQVESRAQMTMLPRLRPRSFYDLVIEVAIVRPGPIQGDMVHPYLRRRNGEEPVELSLATALQGRARQDPGRAAVPGAGDADRHRRRRLHPRRGRPAAPRHGDLPARRHDPHLPRQVHRRHGRRTATTRDFAERCFQQIEGFGDYGFPESHAASFALLVYVSAWLKCHYPAVFACALLNSQPMGFYAPAQIVRDAREHGVEVPPGRRQRQRLGLHARGGSGSRGGSGGSATCRGRNPPCARRGCPHIVSGAAPGLSPGQGAEGGGAHAAGRGPGRGLPRSCRPAPPLGRQRRDARSPGAGRCLHLARAGPARRALEGARPRAHRPRARPAAAVRLGPRPRSRRQK